MVVAAAHLHHLLDLRVRRQLREHLERHAVLDAQLAVVVLPAYVRDTSGRGGDRVELPAGDTGDVPRVVQHSLGGFLVDKVPVAQLTRVVSPTGEQGPVCAEHDAVVVAAGSKHDPPGQKAADGPGRELAGRAPKTQLRNKKNRKN